MMRWTLAVGLAVVLQCGLLTATARAQQTGGRTATGVSKESDLLRPYVSDQVRSTTDQTPSAYVRRPVAKRPAAPPIRTARAAGSRGVGDYYPGMRSGQGANANAVDPRLLTPSKGRTTMPMMMRGR